jgi:methylenetetrahydrofolate--tRNA-(uracil-5-)-methyltransferase
MTGALVHYATHAALKDFQPMKANFGILPPLELERRQGKLDRARAHSERAIADLQAYMAMIDA